MAEESGVKARLDNLEKSDERQWEAIEEVRRESARHVQACPQASRVTDIEKEIKSMAIQNESWKGEVKAHISRVTMVGTFVQIVASGILVGLILWIVKGH